MTREEAIAEIEKYDNLCIRALVALHKVKQSDDVKQIFRVAKSPLPLIQMFIEGIPLSRGIKGVREERGFSIEDMERLTGINKETLESYEKPNSYTSYDDAEKIRKALNCSREYIVEMFDKKGRADAKGVSISDTQ